MIGSPTDRLKKYGIDIPTADKYKVLLLPENIDTQKDDEELKDTVDSLLLYKTLKSENIECANSRDLNLDSFLFERRGDEIWFGTIWILENIVVPVVLTIILERFMIAKKPKNEMEEMPAKNGNRQAHLELCLPDGNNIKYEGDVGTLSVILGSIIEEYSEVSSEDEQ